MDTASLKTNVIGCDIGGANLKLAFSSGLNDAGPNDAGPNDAARCTSRVFPMWLKPNELATELLAMIREFDVTEDTPLAVTMTGELADCFATRRDGVQQILAQVEQAYAAERTYVYAVGNRWLSPQEAIAAPWDVAASNWYALATWIGSFADHRVDLVLDIGSTTVDIIPMKVLTNGHSFPATCARTDRDRLEQGQLVYTGLERTPLAAIVRSVLLDGRDCPVMAERFATSDDCYIVLGLTSESVDDCDTADNRPRTVANAHARLARMVGEDSETMTIESARQIAHQVIEAQATQIADAIARNLPNRAAHITVVGHGRELAHRALSQLARQPSSITWLADRLSPAAARCGPALAVASLLAEHLQKPS